MAGFADDPNGNDVVYADNVDFSGGATPTGQVTTNAQLLIGSTIAPNIQVGTLTSPLSTISIGYSNPNITLDVSGSKVLETLTGDTGGAVSPSAGNINLSGATTTFVTGTPATHNLKTEVVSTLNTILFGQGATTASIPVGPFPNGTTIIGNGGIPTANTLTAGTGITIANGPGTITISASAIGMTWLLIAANTVGLTNHGYIAVSPGGALTVSLPATSSLGDIFELVLDGATSWQITQTAGQQIRVSSSQTTSGASGSITSTGQGDAIRLVCEVANLRWVATGFTGNLTIT